MSTAYQTYDIKEKILTVILNIKTDKHLISTYADTTKGKDKTEHLIEEARDNLLQVKIVIMWNLNPRIGKEVLPGIKADT